MDVTIATVMGLVGSAIFLVGAGIGVGVGLRAAVVGPVVTPAARDVSRPNAPLVG